MRKKKQVLRAMAAITFYIAAVLFIMDNNTSIGILFIFAGTCFLIPLIK